MVGDEVETWECLLFLLQIVVQGFLTLLNVRMELLKCFFTTFLAGCLDDHGVLRSIVHDLTELVVDLLEKFGIVGQLASNIL